MTAFWSCHLMVDRKLADDRRHVGDFIDAEFLSWGSVYILFLKWTPSTNANMFSHYYPHLG